MGRPYSKELAELPAAIAAVASADLDGVSASLRRTASGPAVFVGSGGARAVAEVGAVLHRSRGRPAWAMTPLEFEQLPPMPTTSVVIISASGKNRDTRAAARRAACWDLAPTVVTARSREQLHPEVGQAGVNIAFLPSPGDGFLATGSTLSFATFLCRAYGYDKVPDRLGLGHLPEGHLNSLASVDRLLVLYGPEGLPAAMDLEIRLSEVGFSAVQLADLRNFAHGRHVGLHRNRSRTGILHLIDPASRGLGHATAQVIPGERPVELTTSFTFPYSAVDLMVLSARATGVIGRSLGIDPGRPGVPKWGRKLYTMSRRMAPAANCSPVARKLTHLPAGFPVEAVEGSFGEWMSMIRRVRFGGLVLDYDGTCCQTADRYERISIEVATALTRLLDEGLTLGIASGRGRSLFTELRAALPERFWSQVLVGTYNCHDTRPLSHDPPARAAPRGKLAKAAERLQELELVGLNVTARAGQVQIESALDSASSGPSIMGLVSSILARQPQIACRVVASGHSVDVLSPQSSKLRLLDAVSKEVDGEVLVVGDQGGELGNDFELLAATPWSLTVGSCSSDPSRCWRLGDGAVSGPPLLVAYLSALRRSAGAWTFDWSADN